MSNPNQVAVWISERELPHPPWPVLEAADSRHLPGPRGMQFGHICHVKVHSGFVEGGLEIRREPEMENLMVFMSNPCVPVVECFDFETETAIEGNCFHHVGDRKNGRGAYVDRSCDWAQDFT